MCVYYYNLVKYAKRRGCDRGPRGLTLWLLLVHQNRPRGRALRAEDPQRQAHELIHARGYAAQVQALEELRGEIG